MANDKTDRTDRTERTQSAQVKKNTRAEEWLRNAVKDKHVRMIPFSEISKVKYNVAKGGSGTIHLGAWRNMHVAIKEQHNTNDLIKELKMHKQVHDSNYIVKFFGITKHPLTHDTCIVMQFAENGCLQDFLETRNITITWLTKYRLAWEISSGLDFIHRENIFHTDLHSRNILIDTHGKALITDFGLSKSVNKTIYTTKAGLFGVVPYVAPERMQNPTYTYNAKCDIYSLGVIFWELSSCVIPFEAQLQDVMLAVNIIAGVREKSVPGTAVEYEMLYRRCWDGLPQNRPTMDIVLSELVELLAAEQLNPRPASLSPRPPRPLSSESMVAPGTPFPYENEAAPPSSPEISRPSSPPLQRPGVLPSIAQGLAAANQDRAGTRVSFMGERRENDVRPGQPPEQGQNVSEDKLGSPNRRALPATLPDSPTVTTVHNDVNINSGVPQDEAKLTGSTSTSEHGDDSTAPQLLPPLPAFKELALTAAHNNLPILATVPAEPNNGALPETASLALANGIPMASVVSKLNLGTMKKISTISPPPPGAPPPPPTSTGHANNPRVVSPPSGRPKVISPPNARNQVPLPPSYSSKTISPPSGPPPPPGTPPPGTPPIKPSLSPSPSLNPIPKPPAGPPPSNYMNAPPTSAPPRNPVSPIVYVPATTYTPSASKSKSAQDKKQAAIAAVAAAEKKDSESSRSSSPEPRPTPPRPVPMGFPVVAPMDPHMFGKRVEQSPTMLPSPPPSFGTGPPAAGAGQTSVTNCPASPDLSRRDTDPRNSRPIDVNKMTTSSESGASTPNNRAVNGSPLLTAAGTTASPRPAQGLFPVVETIRAGLTKSRDPKAHGNRSPDATLRELDGLGFSQSGSEENALDQRSIHKEATPPCSQTAAKPRFQFDNFYSLSDPYKDLNVDEPTDFFAAITQGDLETMERLIKVHPSLIDEKVGFWPYPTVLLVAARSKHALEAMKLLVKYGAALDRGDHNGITVLHLVCEQYPNPTEAIVFLTKAGADCNSRDGKKRTPLMALLQNSHIASTKVLLESMRVLFKFGAQIKVVDHQQQRTPLHYAIQHCKEPAPVIELLLKKGADVNAQDSKKSTPLHLVLERMDNEELVQMLLLYGADPSIKNSNKRNALCVAAEYLRVMSAWFLLENDLMSSAPETIKKANELCSKADGPEKNSKPLFKNLLSDWQGKEGKLRRIQLAQDCVFRVQRTPDMKTIDQTQVAIEFLESAGVPLQDPDYHNNNNHGHHGNNTNNNNNNILTNNSIINNNNNNINNNLNNNSIINSSTNNNGHMGGNAVNGSNGFAPSLIGGAGGAPGIIRMNGLRSNSDNSLKGNNNHNNHHGNALNGAMHHHMNGHVQVKELRLAEGVEPLKQTMLPVKSVQQLEKEREAMRMYANMSNNSPFGL
ncbi:hypothetical protein BX616_002193 [Lobosporangium transversale]|nr:hypothetical protein BX616_002193 [Lobosporangium transversale]